MVEVVDGNAPVAAAMFANDVGDAFRPALDLHVGQLAAVEIHPRYGRANLVDDAGMVGQVLAGKIVEQHHRTVGGNETVAGRVVRHPQLHVGRVGGVADIDGVVEQGAGIAAPPEFSADALQAVLAHGRHVGCRDPRRGPLCFGLRAVAEDVAVEPGSLGASLLAQVLHRARFERHDLAVAAEVAFG